MIPWVDLAAQQFGIKAELDAGLARVLAHGQYVQGPEVAELEARLSALTGAVHCTTCGNGTDALQIALMALGVGPGDEVIVPAFGFIAPAEAIALLGARPTYVEVEADTFNLSASHLEAAISPRTKAVVTISLFGQCADHSAINAIAAKHRVPVIEDAAQSLGATQFGVQSGNLTRIACTSFFPTKPLGCYGDGGALFTSDPELAVALRQIARHGQSTRYHHLRVGVNSRLDTLQAAVLLAKLSVFESERLARDRLAERYTQALADTDCVTPVIRSGNRSAWAQYTLRVKDRPRVIDALKAQGIPTAVHYPRPLYRQPAVAQSLELPVTEELCREVLSVPIHAYMTDEQAEQVCRALRRAVER